MQSNLEIMLRNNIESCNIRSSASKRSEKVKGGQTKRSGFRARPSGCTGITHYRSGLIRSRVYHRWKQQYHDRSRPTVLLLFFAAVVDLVRFHNNIAHTQVFGTSQIEWSKADPHSGQTFLSGEWTNNCGTPESPLLGRRPSLVELGLRATVRDLVEEAMFVCILGSLAEACREKRLAALSLQWQRQLCKGLGLCFDSGCFSELLFVVCNSASGVRK